MCNSAMWCSEEDKKVLVRILFSLGQDGDNRQGESEDFSPSAFVYRTVTVPSLNPSSIMSLDPLQPYLVSLAVGRTVVKALTKTMLLQDSFWETQL